MIRISDNRPFAQNKIPDKVFQAKITRLLWGLVNLLGSKNRESFLERPGVADLVVRCLTSIWQSEITEMQRSLAGRAILTLPPGIKIQIMRKISQADAEGAIRRYLAVLESGKRKA